MLGEWRHWRKESKMKGVKRDWGLKRGLKTKSECASKSVKEVI